MKISQRGFIVPLVLVLVVLLVIGVGLYMYHAQLVTAPSPIAPVATSTADTDNSDQSVSDMATSTTQITPDTTISISGDTLSVMHDGSVVQTLSLDQDAVTALDNLAGMGVTPFITDQDVNSDGYDDLAVFTTSGYEGVNDYYDYYIFNPKTGMYDKSAVLVNISNPVVDTSKKQIQSHYRSGAAWYTDTFQFNGSTFVEVSKDILDQ